MDKAHLPFFSVIIPSYNRKDDLEALLPALVNQTLPTDQYEVILVDDGSTDGTDEFANTFRERSPMRLRFLKQDHRGAGAARNYGMQEASGQVFVFIDSDCIAPPNWLAEIRKAFDRDPSIDAFGGRDDASGDFSSPAESDQLCHDLVSHHRRAAWGQEESDWRNSIHGVLTWGSVEKSSPKRADLDISNAPTILN